jgi:hypothetical protein
MKSVKNNFSGDQINHALVAMEYISHKLNKEAVLIVIYKDRHLS